MSQIVHFVGAGPGAPDLITVRGSRLLASADLIVYTGSLVNPQLLGYARDGCEILDSSTMTLAEVIEAMLAGLKAGGRVVRLHTGDPSVYGAIREQMDELEKAGVSYDVTPGVSACFGAAASLGMEYTVPGISQSLVITRMAGRTKVPPKEQIEDFAAHGTSMAIYLSTGKAGELSNRLIDGGYSADTPAAIVYKATWPEERRFRCTIGELGKVAEENDITKTAVILVGEAVAARDVERSRLYDPKFETGYRNGT